MSFFEKLKKGMSKTRENISEKINSVLSAFTKVDEDLLEELEETLILCDMGVGTTQKIIDELMSSIKQNKITEPEDVKAQLNRIIEELVTYEVPEEKFPRVILVVGVNGVGKTTSIGKIANLYKKAGKTVLLAAQIPSEQPLQNSSQYGRNAAMCRSSSMRKVQTLRQSYTMR